MMNRLSVYWSVMHRRPQDYSFFKTLQPTVFKIMDGGSPDYAFARENLPNSLVIARDWALSEQHDDMRRDPTGTGRRHAQEWHRHAARLGFDRKNTLILGINEPRVWESGVPEALRQYTIAMCAEATDLGLRVGAMQLGVGWPNNTGPDTPPDWTPWHGVEDAIRKSNGALITHEYWADNGPSENWGWWAGRTLKCPWNVPIVIGECGIDMFVKSAQFQGSRGWNGQVPPSRYAGELAEYIDKMSRDSRFVGACVFASDYANREWFTFDIEPAYRDILNTPVITPPVPPPPPPPPPPISPPISPPIPPSSISGIIDPRVAQAILKIESGGRTHGEDGRMIIRFEAHIFKTYLGNDDLWALHFRTDQMRGWVDQMWRRTQADPWKAIHTGRQVDEWEAFEFANSLNAWASYLSISMGAAQIMGFNHQRIGYSTAVQMFAGFQSAQMQIVGFINFFLSNPELIDAARRRDWREIAKFYNGAGNIDVYAPLLERAYRELGG